VFTAARDKQAATEKKGWFGGWFKKDPNAPTVHKAKLGEESSFVYDPELKKWVNKKAGATPAPSAAATPPPPKGLPSRATSMQNLKAPSATPPTSNPTQRSVSNPSSQMPPPPRPSSGLGTPPRSESPAVEDDAPPPALVRPSLNALPSGPPSRPSTALSNASSIDDLIGVPQSRKPSGMKKPKKGGRYVDVMGQK
jgi:COPII coat assembly protein SEC16